MKKNRLFNLALLLVTVPFVQESFAQTTLEGHRGEVTLGGVFTQWETAGFGRRVSR